MGHNQPLGGNLLDTTSHRKETCRTQPAAGRKPAGHNHPPEGHCRTQPAAGRKTAGQNQPPEGNLPDTTSHRKETCRTQPATGRKLPDTTSHRKETCRTQRAAGRKTAGHNQPPEGNCRKQPATGRKLPDTTIHRKETAGNNQPTPQCLRHLLLHGHSHTFSAGLPGQVTVSPQNCSILTRSMRWPPGYPK